MVWLVQNCRSNKCLQFLKPPELPGGLRPLSPLPGLYPRPAEDLKAVTRPLAYSRPPLTTNPGSAPGDHLYLSNNLSR